MGMFANEFETKEKQDVTEIDFLWQKDNYTVCTV